MIFDRISNIHLYSEISPALTRALNYLKETDFSKEDAARTEIEGENIFSIINK